MNLATLAATVCSKLGKVDPASLAVAKNYLRQRHEMVYDAALWKDTVDTWEASAAAGSERVVLPFEVSRPVAVWDKSNDLPMAVTSLVEMANTMPSQLEEVSGLWKFVEAPSGGWAWDLGPAGDALAITNNTVDDATVTIRGRLKSTLSPLPDREAEQSFTVGKGGGIVVTPTWLRIDRMSKVQTPGDILVTQIGRGSAGLWWFPAAAEEAVFAVVRLIPPTSSAVTLGILGKRKLRQMRQDGDSPMIRGIDNVLLAFALADMLERSRQYGKAQAKTAEGTGLLKIAVDNETGQSAHEARIVPVISGVEGTTADLYG